MIVSSLAVCKSLESNRVAVTSLFDLSGSSRSLLKFVKSPLESSLKFVISEGQTGDHLGGLVSTIGNVLDGASVLGGTPLVLANLGGLGSLLTGDEETEAGLHTLLGLGDALGGLETVFAGHGRGVEKSGVRVAERGVTDLSSLGTWSLNLKGIVFLGDHPNNITGNLYHFGLITKES